MASPSFDPATIANNAKSGSQEYCYGYQNIDTSGCYISTLKLETGVVDVRGLKDEVLAGIVSYDRAEKDGAYIGQINMITVSSFSGPNAAVWGYDLAQSDTLRSKPLFKVPPDNMVLPEPYRDDEKKLPANLRQITIYDVEPLLEATEALFGSVTDRRFRPLAGAHVPCAAKSANSIDGSTGEPNSGWVWCYIALAIADNRSRDACLFVENAGFFEDTMSYGTVTALSEEEVVEKLDKKRYQVVFSQFLCGINQHTPFKEIFVGYKYKRVDPGYYGCALTCAPYVLLAQNAYPGGDANNLVTMKLSEWEDSVFSDQDEAKKKKRSKK